MILGMKIPQQRVSLRQMTDYGAGHTCVMAVAHCVPGGKVILGTGYSGETSKVEVFAKLRESALQSPVAIVWAVSKLPRLVAMNGTNCAKMPPGAQHVLGGGGVSFEQPSSI
ncbi:hypothetical protein N3K66_003516 [Trichothecium roseum]|uniref:Uncharacterized protein n=1 Tax=Trichothecium roseum TaxID=47278 RepID=A0ACC0V7L0_9HYPO|nr:hypothetical protein N3K66_003516 [Trichothecium roseum]